MPLSKKAKIFFGISLMTAIFLGISSYSIFKESPDVTPTSEIILFYGRECSLCRDLEKFLADNKVANKVQYDSVEVWHNANNAKILMEKAAECGLTKDKLGVPLVYSAKECFMGAPAAEKFFRDKMNF